jgi:hypothetical protein
VEVSAEKKTFRAVVKPSTRGQNRIDPSLNMHGNNRTRHINNTSVSLSRVVYSSVLKQNNLLFSKKDSYYVLHFLCVYHYINRKKTSIKTLTMMQRDAKNARESALIGALPSLHSWR